MRALCGNSIALALAFSIYNKQQYHRKALSSPPQRYDSARNLLTSVDTWEKINNQLKKSNDVDVFVKPNLNTFKGKHTPESVSGYIRGERKKKHSLTLFTPLLLFHLQSLLPSSDTRLSSLVSCFKNVWNLFFQRRGRKKNTEEK
jgi:hypothetical protein